VAVLIFPLDLFARHVVHGVRAEVANLDVFAGDVAQIDAGAEVPLGADVAVKRGVDRIADGDEVAVLQARSEFVGESRAGDEEALRAIAFGRPDQARRPEDREAACAKRNVLHPRVIIHRNVGVSDVERPCRAIEIA
jgi:hypothetical protein